MEKRRFSRIPFSADCSFSCATVSCRAELVDISLKGALIRLENERCPIDTDCSLALYLDGLETPLLFGGKVVHTREDRVGIMFVSTDVESMIHLRRLLETNSMNPDRVLDELGMMIGDVTSVSGDH